MMKKNDLVLIIVVGIVAGIFSLVSTNLIFTPKNIKNLKAQKIDAIDSSFNQVDKKYFNSESINPTQLIQIGDKANPQPF